ncbi:mycothiol synthase [Corynebacterium sp. ES2794-CONJ1]|uniref:mycothiol synthase n=1 Tax=Corynebacterium sp. ES2794-CONJ1 TaxID=2980553 RepID=UPI0021DAA17C|nr:mycothiol synthase [Corynebacterium sp. ES2794-CONJ1]MCU9519388.1 mycothiol synthase [Corynebacterium sp. ES2794-CONJ1]
MTHNENLVHRVHTEADHSALKDLIEEVYAHDHIAPISEGYMRILEGKAPGDLEEIRVDDQRAGLVITDEEGVAEFFVAPVFRNRGVGQQIARGIHEMWAHGDLAPAQKIAARLNLNKTRELLVMEIDGENLAGAVSFKLEHGLRFEHMQPNDPLGDLEFLRVNNEAFDWHPEQGGWDQTRLDSARSAAWFRYEDVLLLKKGSELIGFHWLKRHGNLDEGAPGEIYVVGLATAGRGRGLGGPLVAAGLQHLVSQGAQRVILYVESDNEPAVRRYREMGFEIIERHVVYRQTEGRTKALT